MTERTSDLLEKIRQQFNMGPYPRIPLEQSPKSNFNTLSGHNLVTPYYLKNQKIIETEGKIILDAGCGTGYKSLALAEANPGAKIVGIDLSEESVKLARERLQYHGFDTAEFYALSIEDLPTFGLHFDYINADEVLYLLPDPLRGLQAMKSVLKPEGIIRTNLHSSIQRDVYFRAQQVFRMMGLMEATPRVSEVEIVRETMKALKDEIFLKQTTWKPHKEDDEEFFQANYLLQGDKGYTVPEMFSLLKEADLEFVSMVKWRYWDLMELFKEDDLPAFLGMSLPETSLEERLHLFELLQPVHRLLDFWCARPNQTRPFVAVAEWTNSDWQRAVAHLHPQLRTARVREDLLESIAHRRSWEISRYITESAMVPIQVESTLAACLLPLWEGAQPVTALVKRWIEVRPVHPATLEPVREETAFEEVKELLSDLEAFLYLLLERSA